MVKRTKKSFKNTVQTALGDAETAENIPPNDAETLKPDKIDRDKALAEIPEDRRKLVQKWQQEIRADKHYFSDVFKRMREDMEYARLGAKKDWVDKDNYTVPLIGRFINQAVASLYAKNPKAVAKRRQKLMYQVWDGTVDTAKAALMNVQNAQQTGQQPDPTSVEILQEAQGAKQQEQMMQRAGRTLEILFQYYTGEDYPDFKKRIKSCVRRAKTTAVGYCEISYHRALEPDPDVTNRIGDMTRELELIKSREADKKDDEYPEDDPRATELRSMLETLEDEKMVIIEDSPVFDFPRSTDIIPHRACTLLAGFIGADYVTREYLMDPEDIQAKFKKDIGSSYKPYVETNGANIDGSTGGASKEGERGDPDERSPIAQPAAVNDGKTGKGKALVWRVMNKKTRQIFWLCDGYPDYLKEPAAPDLQVQGFWTIFPLIFNEVEDEKEIFPPSDTNYLKHPQREFNNAREGVREHRKANRPMYFAKRGALEEEDKKTLEARPAHAVVELSGLEGDVKINDLIQAYKPVGIDPNMYDTGNILKDIELAVGAQAANLGPVGEATATESNISEQSTMSTLASNVDDLDEWLSEIARAFSQIALQQMDQQTVISIVGPGAVWPQLNIEQISKELFLEIKAGSSGRPNQAAELANLERAMTFLVQLGGVSGTVLAKKYCDLIDIDEDELIVEGLPSITALNAMATQQASNQGQMQVNQHASTLPAPAPKAPAAGAPPSPGAPQPHAGAPAANPAAQGPQGAQNMPQPAGVAPQGQPAFPTSIHRYNAQGARVQ